MDTCQPDPGSPRAAKWALLLSFLLFVVVAGLQMLGGRTALAPTEEGAYTLPAPDEGSQLLESRIAMGLHDLLGSQADASIGEPPGAAIENPPTAENLRAAPIIAFLKGREAALEHLRLFRGAAGAHADRAFMVADADRFERALKGDALADTDRDAFLRDHGWFARLALAFPTPEASPEREAALRPAVRLVTIILLGALGAVFALIAGLVLLIVFAVKIGGKRLQRGFVRPAPGGSVYLETFGAFLAGFLAVQIVVGVILAAVVRNQSALWWIGMGTQWLLMGVVAYPLLRGVPLSRLRQDLGLTRGKGVLREMGAGIVGYLAGLPLLLAGFGVVILIQWYVKRQGGAPLTPNNPIMDATSTGDAATMVMIFALATIWAPLVEETIFRGALYRHARSRLTVLPAALLVGLLFAFMHSYGPAFTPPLIVLGTTFALLREWRGTLIAPMTAHALHNGTIMSMLFLVTTAGGA